MASDSLSAGRAAFARRAWAEASDVLSAAEHELADSISISVAVEDLERLAVAAYLSGRDQQSSDAWLAAHRARLDQGDPDGAVLCAFWLAFGLIQRGEMAEGGGWLARAEHLVADHTLDSVGTGYLLVPRGLTSLGRGAHSEGLQNFEAAGAIARRFDDPDLMALSRLGCGQSLRAAGRMVEGADCLDEAMVAVTSGEVSPVVAGIVYCAVIDECQRAFDVSRARQWTMALTRWCDDQPELVRYRGQCLVHRAQVLQLHGAWPEAFEEAERARDRLTEPRQPAIGMAHYQLGELQRLWGELEEAATSYRSAQEHGCSPHPGLALVWLTSGEIGAAAAAIDGAVAGAGNAASRAQQLPAFVEIMLAAGRVDDARAAASELAALGQDNAASYLTAAAAHAKGAVALADGDPRSALGPLRDACRIWAELEAPYHTARSRLLVSDACHSIGDVETAQLELKVATRSLAQLGARLDRDRFDQPASATDQMATTVTEDMASNMTGERAGSGLTEREVQVLRRVVNGATNREIAADLFVSVKTIERHLSNIFRKLDVPNRAAATAAAYEAGLLRSD